MKDKVSWVIAELPHANRRREDHILYEKAYNTGQGISAIPVEIRGEIRRQPCQPKAQQKQVVHLLLESPLGRGLCILGPPLPVAPSFNRAPNPPDTHFINIVYEFQQPYLCQAAPSRHLHACKKILKKGLTWSRLQGLCYFIERTNRISERIGYVLYHICAHPGAVWSGSSQ